MIVFVTTVDNEVTAVSSNWSTDMRRLMEDTGYTEYKECKKVTDSKWEVIIPDGTLRGHITRCWINKRVVQ